MTRRGVGWIGVLVQTVLAVWADGGEVHHWGATNPVNETPPWTLGWNGGTVAPGTDTINQVEYPYWEINTPSGQSRWYEYQGISDDFTNNWGIRAIVRLPTLSSSLFNAYVAVAEGTKLIAVGLRSDGLFWSKNPNANTQESLLDFAPDSNKYYKIVLVRDRNRDVVHVLLDDVKVKELPFAGFQNYIYFTNMVHFGDGTGYGGASVTRWHAVNFYPLWPGPWPGSGLPKGVEIGHYGSTDPLKAIRAWQGWLNSTPTPGTDTVNQVDYPYWQIAANATWTYYSWQGGPQHFASNWVLRAVVRPFTLTSQAFDCFMTAIESNRLCGVGLRTDGLYYCYSASSPYHAPLYLFSPDTNHYYEIMVVRNKTAGTVEVFLDGVLRGTLTFSTLPLWSGYANVVHFGDWTSLGSMYCVSRWNTVEFYPEGIPKTPRGTLMIIK